MLEKNTRTTQLLQSRPSCLVLFDSGASPFSSLKHTISFPSSIILLAFPLAFSFHQAGSTRELPLSMKPYLQSQRATSKETRSFWHAYAFRLCPGFIPDKMLGQPDKMLDQMLASTRPSQSNHNTKSDFSMPESFDSVDVAFSHLPRSSSFVSIITSSTSSFRSSFHRLHHHFFHQ